MQYNPGLLFQEQKNLCQKRFLKTSKFDKYIKIPYRTKLRRTKVTNFFGGDENFVRRKILSDESFVQFFF